MVARDVIDCEHRSGAGCALGKFGGRPSAGVCWAKCQGKAIGLLILTLRPTEKIPADFEFSMPEPKPIPIDPEAEKKREDHAAVCANCVDFVQRQVGRVECRVRARTSNGCGWVGLLGHCPAGKW